jgi:hypothetical protein
MWLALPYSRFVMATVPTRSAICTRGRCHSSDLSRLHPHSFRSLYIQLVVIEKQDLVGGRFNLPVTWWNTSSSALILPIRCEAKW